MKRCLRLLLLLGLVPLCLLTRAGAAGQPSTFVDADGVWRWSGTRAELTLFGVNYTTPFAYSFRAHRRMGIDWHQAIDADVYHFTRLGFDVYRVHVWDREISDAQGNLIVNEHVDAFDYLAAQLKRRGIKLLITPLQFGDAGYPEPGVPLPGFSAKYGKRGSLEDRESWPLQERYLAQFLSHVNPHTGLAYKDDPDVVGIEICNEPGHFEYEPTLAYINTMVQAIRSTGYKNPIFYNMSHGMPAVEAYLDASVQGGTFQWYPTNLVAQHEQRGNFLPYVDRYPIPFADHPKFRKKARMVYEFDPADTNRSYLYPAMARSFRTAGFQLATQFAYDPLYLAPFNTEYQTHYFNIAYTPSKAIGMMIAGQAFRRVPLGRDYGPYPQNTTFEGVHLDYRAELAELVTDERFYHSNPTATRPPAPERLRAVAGYGSSPVVTYPGRGAYFLDQVEPGVWRLEVMPDAVPVRDPFERPSPKKPVVRIAWNAWPMHIDLPDLGPDFRMTPLNTGNTLAGRAASGTVTVRPGAYLLARDGVSTRRAAQDAWQHLRLGEFVAPAPSIEHTVVVHAPAAEATASTPLRITATVAAPRPPARVEVVFRAPEPRAHAFERVVENPRPQPGGGNAPGTGPKDTHGARVAAMTATGLDYAAELPAEALHPGMLSYHIVVTADDGSVTTFPSQLDVPPDDWTFHGQAWETRLVAADAPVLLFDAATDHAAVTADYRGLDYARVASDRPGTTAIEVTTREVEKQAHDHSFRFFFRDKIAARAEQLGRAHRLVLFGRSATEQSCPVQLALVSRDGVAYGAPAELSPRWSRVEVDLAALHPVRMPNIPHGYPEFIPFWSEPGRPVAFDATDAEVVLVSIGPGLAADQQKSVVGIQVEKIWLE